MIFKGIDNQSVELVIANYEFPNSDDKEHDGNWLNIYLNVKSKQGYWQTIDPSLLTWDVQAIIDWFNQLSQNQKPKWNELEFIEPNLSFKLENKPMDESKLISIHFDLESRPKSAKDNVDYYVECRFNNVELKAVAIELQKELIKYPKRD
jgi:hypothetical protein